MPSAQVRVWSIPEQRVVDWADVHEMVTAAAFAPDGRRACVGTMKGRCRFYVCEPSFRLEYQAQIGEDFSWRKPARRPGMHSLGCRLRPVLPCIFLQSRCVCTSACCRLQHSICADPLEPADVLCLGCELPCTRCTSIRGSFCCSIAWLVCTIAEASGTECEKGHSKCQMSMRMHHSPQRLHLRPLEVSAVLVRCRREEPARQLEPGAQDNRDAVPAARPVPPPHHLQ